MPTGTSDLASTAHEALAQHRWQEAFDLFTRADEQGTLSGADLEALSEAAFFTANADLRLEALERAFTAVSGKNPPNVELSKEERGMAEQVFVPVSDLKAYDAAIDTVKKMEGLHDVMLFEVFNFADGRRSAYDVYEAVAAEALAAGAWQYGTVKPAAVLEALDTAAKAGAFTLRGK